MPIYIYKKESTGEVREVLQKMNDVHEYHGENGDEEDWKRVFLAPNASIDTKINPHSSKEFVDKTGTKKGTVGDMLDLSKELSERRAEECGGTDPVKQEYFDKYAKERKGARHPEEKKKLETDKVKVEF